MTIFEIDVPIRDILSKGLGDGVRLFPGGAVENMKMPYVWVSREKADVVPTKGADKVYHCRLSCFCFTEDYRAGVVLAGKVMEALDGQRLRYSGDDGGVMDIDTIRVSGGEETIDSQSGASFYQEVVVECTARVRG